MAFGNAIGRVANPRFVRRAGLVAGGLIAASFATDFLRNNVVDLDMTGGDAIYALAGAMGAMMVLPRGIGEPLALGMGAAGINTAINEMGVV